VVLPETPPGISCENTGRRKRSGKGLEVPDSTLTLENQPK
jgi:hypothetical protein